MSPDSPGSSFGTGRAVTAPARRRPEPAGLVALHREVARDGGLDLQLQRVVPALPAQRGERVERAPLVEVDQGDPAAAAVGEGHQGAQQRRPEPRALQCGVDRVQVGDEVADAGGRGGVAGGPGVPGTAAQHQPGVAVLVGDGFDPGPAVGVEQVGDLALQGGERLPLGGPERHRPRPRRRETGGGLQRHGGRRQREEPVEIGLGRLGTAQQGAEEAHGLIVSLSRVPQGRSGLPEDRWRRPCRRAEAGSAAVIPGPVAGRCRRAGPAAAGSADGWRRAG